MKKTGRFLTLSLMKRVGWYYLFTRGHPIVLALISAIFELQINGIVVDERLHVSSCIRRCDGRDGTLQARVNCHLLRTVESSLGIFLSYILMINCSVVPVNELQIHFTQYRRHSLHR